MSSSRIETLSILLLLSVVCTLATTGDDAPTNYWRLNQCKDVKQTEEDTCNNKYTISELNGDVSFSPNAVRFKDGFNESIVDSAHKDNVLVKGVLATRMMVRGAPVVDMQVNIVYRLLPMFIPFGSNVVPEVDTKNPVYMIDSSSVANCQDILQCSTLRLDMVNTDQHVMASSLSHPYSSVPGFDHKWLNDLLTKRSSYALISGRLNGKKFMATGIYVNVEDREIGCPEVLPKKCDNPKETNAFIRNTNRCVVPNGCTPVHRQLCPGIVLKCSNGYRLQAFTTAPHGCNSFYCDASFLQV
ncbi:hypothetical protein SAMD00019534_003940, partial [Acytostelium subglobosum LB1]|uniref:hypothetical protein n=1 Tax=Acytostelium subglobosum LB1 TaxID=1410327 RepID=UPI000644A1FA